MEKEILDYDRLAGDVSIFDFLETDSEDLIKDRGIQPFHVVHNTPHYAPPPPPPSFAQAWSSISLRTTVNTQEKLETMVMQSFFFGGGGRGGGGVLKRCIMGNVKMVSYHPSDHFF